jgi:hypothetical protein
MRSETTRRSRLALRNCIGHAGSAAGKMASAAALACVLGLGLMAADRAGIVPLESANAYPRQAERDSFTLGAKILSAEDVRRLFASDLNKRYVVVEVAVYPREGQLVNVSADQFVLYEEVSSESARAAAPRDAARILQQTNAKRGGRDIVLYPQMGVGYSSGGPYRRGGVDTSVGVGVGVGGPGEPEADTPEDRDAMEAELSEKGLPSGDFAKPVAGYLYFPLKLRKPAEATLTLEQWPDSAAKAWPRLPLDLPGNK